MKASQTKKVIRWRLYLQDFNFTVHHIAGVDNAVADGLSRCCAIENKESILSSFHNAIMGHCGHKELFRRCKSKSYNWNGIHNDINEFIQKCSICQKVRTSQLLQPSTISIIQVSQPFEEVSIDTVGPLPLDSLGNKYVITIIDSFTRYVELIPTKDTTAESAAMALLNTFSRYGPPRKIRSDRGTQFTANLIQKFCAMLKIDQTFTPAYHPQANSIVERSHRELIRHLRALLYSFEDKPNWSKWLPLVQRIQNSTYCRAIGMTPTELLFAGQLETTKWITPLNEEDGITYSVTTADLLTNLQAEYHNLLNIAKQTQERYIQSSLQRNEGKGREFDANEYILIENSAESKIDTPWIGPLVVVQKCGSNTYECQDLRTKKISIYPSVKMKRFYFNPDTTNPLVEAAKDHEEYEVQEILEHRKNGNANKLNNFEFKIRWKNYQESDDSWLPYKEVRQLEALDNYLKHHPSVKLPLR